MTANSAPARKRAAGADLVAAERALERLFRLTANRTVHTRQAAAVGLDVTRTGYAVLRCVDEAGELSLGEVARQCAMDPAATTRQVRALERHGLLERAARSDDGRVALVRLTDRGRSVYRRIVEVRTDYLASVLAGWPPDEVAQLARLVDRLVDDLRTTPIPPLDQEHR